MLALKYLLIVAGVLLLTGAFAITMYENPIAAWK